MNLTFRLASGEADTTAALPGSLHVNRRLCQWLRFNREGFAEIFSGKVELGQGVLTALAQIAAEELELTLTQIRMVPASTTWSPDEAITSGSLSVQESGTALRHACAEARAIYLHAAAARLEVAVELLYVTNGTIAGPDGKRTSYWALAQDPSLSDLLDREATGAVAPKAAEEHRIVGHAVPRLDLPDKVFGRGCYVHDMELPAMLHGRVLRPPSQSAVLIGFDGSSVRTRAGVVGIICDGSFIGVLAEDERTAHTAIEALAAETRWTEPAELPDEAAITAWLKVQPSETKTVDRKTAPREGTVARTLKAAYSKPFLAHASIAPSCALARWEESRLTVWTHSQGIFNLRRDLALAFAVPEETIAVNHVQGAGCYGHNGADDVAFDAARLARACPGRPVRVQWSRADELAWAPFGPAMAIELEADLDAAGAIVGWRHTIWSNGHSSRPGRASSPTLLGSWHVEPAFERLAAINPPFAAGGGGDRNSVPAYAFPAWHVVNHRVLSMPLRTSALRALGGFANVFAIESFIDELATLMQTDPVAFRMRYLADPRARAVIERVAADTNWTTWRGDEGFGHGIGFARYKNTGAYCAVVAEIEVGREVLVRRLSVAVDVGLVVNPDGVVNQIEGGAIQATSWTLKEAVRFDRTRVVSDGWERYPILRCSEVPAVDVQIISRPGLPALGAGEAAMGPTAAAIANALFNALGVRVRDLPLTPENIQAAINA